MDRMRKIGGEEEQGRQIQEIEGREETFSFWITTSLKGYLFPFVQLLSSVPCFYAV